jgi:hypothetical protein
MVSVIIPCLASPAAEIGNGALQCQVIGDVSCALALSVGGCASAITGTSEEVTVNTVPPGASCAIERQGVTIATINPTPAAATITRTKYDITIACHKDGFQDAKLVDHSGVEDSAVSSAILVGGVISWAVDSSTGADNAYTTPESLTLAPIAAQAQAQQPAVSEMTSNFW